MKRLLRSIQRNLLVEIKINTIIATLQERLVLFSFRGSVAINHIALRTAKTPESFDFLSAVG